MSLSPSETHGEALFEVVLNTVSDAITVIDKDLKIIYQNKAVHKVYGSKIGERCFEPYRGGVEGTSYIAPVKREILEMSSFVKTMG